MKNLRRNLLIIIALAATLGLFFASCEGNTPSPANAPATATAEAETPPTPPFLEA